MRARVLVWTGVLPSLVGAEVGGEGVIYTVIDVMERSVPLSSAASFWQCQLLANSKCTQKTVT